MTAFMSSTDAPTKSTILLVLFFMLVIGYGLEGEAYEALALAADELFAAAIVIRSE
jgi:hypothetical protein